MHTQKSPPRTLLTILRTRASSHSIARAIATAIAQELGLILAHKNHCFYLLSV